ncbi:hypothetical protein OHT93_15550 [Streptomyces sp. NBC_00191]|uniref:hypothetical protein n=1 Tax=Streptomyces sp. NBC_00191 TaxID=2975674 RepID=UPI0032536E0B
MVGFRLRTGTDRTVRHFYVVRDAKDEHDARRLAARLAHSLPEREAREYAPLDETGTEVLLLHRDALGNWRPTAHHPRPGSNGSILHSRGQVSSGSSSKVK